MIILLFMVFGIWCSRLGDLLRSGRFVVGTDAEVRNEIGKRE